MKTKFQYYTKLVVNKRRAYPANELAKRFLSLNQARKAKSFTDGHLRLIREIAKAVDFEVEEVEISD